MEMTEEITTEPVPADIKQSPIFRMNDDPNLLQTLFEGLTPQGNAALRGGEIFAARAVSFTIDGSICRPGVFERDGLPFDFTLTMRELTAAQELEVLSKVEHGNQVQMAMAKAMLWKLNGTVIKNSNQRDWLWEALGMGGRQLTFLAYQRLASASVVALGKFQAAFTVG